MLINWSKTISCGLALTAVLGLFGAMGCGRGGPRTYPVKGRIELTGAEIKLLTGSYIELALTSDPDVRASGEIQEDGRFKLQTLHSGSIVNGVIEGNYQVRILIADDDREVQRRAAEALDPRYLDFKTSGVAIDVPTRGEVTVTVSAR